MSSKGYVNEQCWYHTKGCVGVGKECTNCLKFLEVNYLMQHSWLPKSKQSAITKLIPKTDNDIEAFEQLDDIRRNMLEFVEDGHNLYLCSEYTGNGKTSWAIKLMHNYFDQVWAGNGLRTRALFVHVPSLLLRLKNFQSPISTEDYNNLKNCDLVVWDDIASTDISKFDYMQLLALIDYRILAEKSNIYTGNIVELDELNKLLGERLASRVYKTSTVIVFDGKDRRQDGGRSSSFANTK